MIISNINFFFTCPTIQHAFHIILVLSWAAHDTAEVEDDSSHSFVSVSFVYHYANHISTKKFHQNICMLVNPQLVQFHNTLCLYGIDKGIFST